MRVELKARIVAWHVDELGGGFVGMTAGSTYRRLLMESVSSDVFTIPSIWQDCEPDDELREIRWKIVSYHTPPDTSDLNSM